MKVFITKYALTVGIVEAEANTTDNPELIFANRQYFWSPDWHEMRDEAVSRAKAMRLNKIASLEKQIAKLRKLEFK